MFVYCHHSNSSLVDVNGNTSGQWQMSYFYSTQSHPYLNKKVLRQLSPEIKYRVGTLVPNLMKSHTDCLFIFLFIHTNNFVAADCVLKKIS